MKAFAELYANLDATTSSNAKLAALQAYFRHAAPEDAAWAVYFLSGGRPRQLVPTRLLRDMATEASGIEPWLFEESYQSVGDLAETISLLLPESPTPQRTVWRCGWRKNSCLCVACLRWTWQRGSLRYGRNWISRA